MTPIFMISGFLGSGKTTLINNLLSKTGSRRIALIVNDFGKLPVDASLIGGNLVAKDELSGGQIFCSCLSGSFVDSVLRYQDMDLDYILVETSGLAKPSVMDEIIMEAEKRSEGKVVYGSFISVLDPNTFILLHSNINAIEEQACYANTIVLNKCDRATEKVISDCRDIIGKLNPKANIIETSFGDVDPSMLVKSEPVRDCTLDFWGWNGNGRPKAFTFEIEDIISADSLRKFIETVARECYRIKGYVKTQEGWKLVQATGDLISIGNCDGAEKNALTIIQDPLKTGDETYPALFAEITKGHATAIC